MSEEEWPVISTYTWQQAVEDGDLVVILKHRWPELTGGIPLLATIHLFNDISLAGLMEIYNDFVMWRRDIMPTLKEEDRMFTTTMNSKTVWLVEDGTTFTLMYPSDY
jgi:hypothetical protein